MRAARVTAFLACAAVASSWPALLAQSAAALEPGVHVDPGSPAAKEYALPVSQARGAGDGGGSEGTREQLFGSGIKPPSSGSSGGGAGAGKAHGGTRGRGGTRSPSSGGKGTTPTAASEPPALVRRVADGRSSSGGGSSALVLLGGGVVVLVLGAFAGVVLRHGRRPTPTA